jgi:lipopolysaccharide biosynthesis glycosyltransferase
MINVFVGYDPREAIAYHVCVNSIIRHSSVPVSIHPLALNNLREYSEKHTDGSNHFIYSRFLVPNLMEYKGWAIFMDGDMILRDDISSLWELRDDAKAALVVQHEYKTRLPIKYLGAKNEDYPRKNWSSVILWNCEHVRNQILTPNFVENATGSQLHRFNWLSDDLIGSLPIEWNWLPDEFGANKNAKLIHHTLGTPCFHDFSTSPMADEWHRERILTEYSSQAGLPLT